MNDLQGQLTLVEVPKAAGNQAVAMLGAAPAIF
jgi:hypothetical protein